MCAAGAGTLKDDQHCYVCGQNGHRQFECPNAPQDVFKLPDAMQAKVEQQYQRDIARMAAGPDGRPAPIGDAPYLIRGSSVSFKSLQSTQRAYMHVGMQHVRAVIACCYGFWQKCTMLYPSCRCSCN